MIPVELTEVFCQESKEFIYLLNSVRIAEEEIANDEGKKIRLRVFDCEWHRPIIRGITSLHRNSHVKMISSTGFGEIFLLLFAAG